jgi:cytidylate kinase
MAPVFLFGSGVAGSGTSTSGKALAQQLDCCFLETDAGHSAANVASLALAVCCRNSFAHPAIAPLAVKRQGDA